MVYVDGSLPLSRTVGRIGSRCWRSLTLLSPLRSSHTFKALCLVHITNTITTCSITCTHARTHARTHAHSPSSHTSYPPARGLLLTSRESCSFSSAVSQETTRQATTCPTLKHTLGSASTGMLTDTAECSIRDNAIQHSNSMLPYCTLSLYRLCIEGTTGTVCV